MSVAHRARAVVLAAVASALSVSACGASSGAADAIVSVVASTDVYGDIVRQVAGDLTGGRVAITSVISGPSADPHSFEANTRTELAISRADLIIENGGGYDDFMEALRHSARSSATLINV